MKKYKRTTLCGIVLAVIILLCCTSACAAQDAASQTHAPGALYELSLAHVYSSEHPYARGAEYIARRIDEASDGAVSVTVYPAGQLGSEMDLVKSCEFGAIDMAICASGELAKRVQALSILDAPYIFEDYQHASEAAQSPLLTPAYQALERESGLIVLSVLYGGARHLTTSDYIVNLPSDLMSKKIRADNQLVSVDVIEQVLGAKATPMNLSEVYMALQNKTVDGQENPVPTIHSQKFHEVQQYLILTGHQTDMMPIIISAASIMEKYVSEDILRVIKNECVSACDEISRRTIEYEYEKTREISEMGVVIMTPSGLDEFKARAAQFVVRYEQEGRWEPGLYDKVRALAE